MSGEERNDRERSRHLMMAELDGELSAEDRRELERSLESDPTLREEWDRLRKVKEVTNTMRLKNPPEEVWNEYWISVYNRIERGIGWILVSIGAIVLLSYGSWTAITELLADASVPGYIKLSILAVAVGGIILLVSVLREKLIVRRKDPYKEVER